MIIKIDHTGCCERKGLMQVKFEFYLEPGEPGYDVHHVFHPRAFRSMDTKKWEALKYPKSKRDPRTGAPLDRSDYEAWAAGLDGDWQVNPFHNHIVCVAPDLTDDEIMAIGEKWAREAFEKWTKDERIVIGDVPDFPDQTKVMARDRRKINVRLEKLAQAALVKKVRAK